MARGSMAPSPARQIEVAIGGKSIKGSYSFADRKVTVTYLGRSETQQLGGAADTAESVAKAMLAKLAGGRGG